ncbi:hypothetical protein EDB85DRAFT_2011681 [Lactarius pseudohatsudake]|nr:hypothetical protein EDB85DRAFT_2011681 [Lactarius pseudohatsudake]
MERSHLSDLMANVQKMHNVIERSEAARDCLPSDFGADEQCSQDSRKISRRVTLQREVDTKELRNTIDNQTRSSLVKAETTKTYLEQRVEELSRNVEGRSHEDQLEAEVADLR